ncbi:FecR family protein [Acinetobacter stercoris]|uniref:Fec operon regulator FecR n=1 Tax=Acinetobacter stercoris TaxID=2126983 RepID=A0A2U3N4N6_9GAMM|nr:FecR domain-containing protein [Acinetobacter stercoris]SPL72584.1 fec operon regulator FecR [Acinetobacter stercoris]
MALQDKQKQKIVAEASEWIVKLSDDEQDYVVIQQQFDCWKSKSAKHQRIAEDIEQYLRAVKQFSENKPQRLLAKSTLKTVLNKDKKYKPLKNYSGFFVLIISLVGGIYSYLVFNPIGYLTADIKGKAGGWQRQQLNDGSVLVLRGKSAVNVSFDKNQRVIDIIQGEVYIDVAKDKSRPFYVRTTHGQIKALGTSFSVGYQPEMTEVKMLHSRVQIIPFTRQSYPKTAVIVEAGQEIRIDRLGVYNLKKYDLEYEQQKWSKHQLLVENEPLSDVLQELNNNYQGMIIFNRKQLEQIRVNAVLPLDQPDDALRLLNSVFPDLKVYKITPYIIYISNG